MAEAQNLTQKNIFEISRSVWKGKVRRLIVADGPQIFGKVNPKNGDIYIHPTQLNHEDDDILDDLAQAVLARGGDVFVCPQSEMHDGRPIVAILEADAKVLKAPISYHSNLKEFVSEEVPAQAFT